MAKRRSSILKRLLKILGMNKILILGDGLLGGEIHKQTGWEYVSRKKDNFDIVDTTCFEKHLTVKDRGKIVKKYDTVINCIANTDTYSDKKELHWDVNFKAVTELVDFCNIWDIKLVHISTDYLYANAKPGITEQEVPVHHESWYAYTKLLGDAYIQLRAKSFLIIRTSHKPYPFPYKKAWKDQSTNGDYVNVIARLIHELVNKDAQGVYNVGTENKTWWELTREEFKTKATSRLRGAPKNVTMSVTKLNKFINNI